MGALLQLEGVVSGYGTVRVLDGVDLAVPEGAVVVLLGPNGAGKTTTLRVIAGLLPTWRGRIMFDGARLDGCRPYDVSRRGVILVPEGRGVFPALTVRENLQVASRADVTAGPSQRRGAVDDVLDTFPRLRERLSQAAGTLSGGEQQMLALGRGLLARPRLLVIDELSLGLAPQVVEQLFATVAELKARHQTVLLVEQYVTHALHVADLCCILDKGRVAFVGDGGELRSADVLTELYMGQRSPRSGT